MLGHDVIASAVVGDVEADSYSAAIIGWAESVFGTSTRNEIAAGDRDLLPAPCLS